MSDAEALKPCSRCGLPIGDWSKCVSLTSNVVSHLKCEDAKTAHIRHLEAGLTALRAANAEMPEGWRITEVYIGVTSEFQSMGQGSKDRNGVDLNELLADLIATMKLRSEQYKAPAALNR